MYFDQAKDQSQAYEEKQLSSKGIFNLPHDALL
jgi:hypothetical protein